ncbi:MULTISPECIES: integration host factor subunit beta [Giesbergeria]|uniref:Integration host factor subunit beta n=1 Tax=Giesbergeria sinuosa TaxID=80883 RepID=A0ABV9QBJ9_9BURK
MTRSDLVDALEARFEPLGHRDAEAVVKTILDAMGATLENSGRIEIRGFGSFSVHVRPPRMGRNPRSGEAVAVPAKQVPHFKAGKALREAVDGTSAEARMILPPL